MQTILTPRSYKSHKDLERMLELLVMGRSSASSSYYIHPGDLSWWLFYTYPEQELWEHIYLWESGDRDGALDGWALLNPHWGTFDVFVHPALRGSDRAANMYIWAEERASENAASAGGKEISTIWVLPDDQVLTGHLEGRGFVRHRDYIIYMTRSLGEQLPQVILPVGCKIRDMQREEDIEQRAVASYKAFQSRAPWKSYLERYRAFRRSPVYRPANDLVLVAPDGCLASFCIFWLDEVNGIGLFEPVGTHPDFQRLGMGRAVMQAGLQRMREAGMQTAAVLADHDNAAALSLYRSLGFQETNRLYAYARKLDIHPAKGQENGG